MNKPIFLENTFNTEGIRDTLTLQANLYREIHSLTRELNELLLNNCGEDILANKLAERGLLINTAATLKKDYDSVKEHVNSADNKGKAIIDELIREIQDTGNLIGRLDAENIALIKNYLKDITCNLEKIQESKHLVGDLKRHLGNSPAFVDVCG